MVKSCKYHLGQTEALLNEAMQNMTAYPELLSFKEPMKALKTERGIIQRELTHQVKKIQEAENHGNRASSGLRMLANGLEDIQIRFGYSTIACAKEDIPMKEGSGE